jgi:hypothetical protein
MRDLVWWDSGFRDRWSLRGTVGHIPEHQLTHPYPGLPGAVIGTTNARIPASCNTTPAGSPKAGPHEKAVLSSLLMPQKGRCVISSKVLADVRPRNLEFGRPDLCN